MPIKLDAKIGGSDPAQPVVPAKIKEMTDRYRKDMPANDTKSCWVSIAEVLQLIADNNGNGIRIYYGRHSDTEASEFKNKHNVILVATRDTIAPQQPTSENSADLLNAYKENGPVNSVIVSFQGMGDDVIPLCPPHCPTVKSILTVE